MNCEALGFSINLKRNHKEYFKYNIYIFYTAQIFQTCIGELIDNNFECKQK